MYKKKNRSKTLSFEKKKVMYNSRNATLEYHRELNGNIPG